MNKDMIRQWCVDGGSEEIKTLLLTPLQLILVRFIWFNGESSASNIADLYDVSVQSASSILNKIYNKGYLKRDKQKQDSGGWEWVYFK